MHRTENWYKKELDDSTAKFDEEEFYDLPLLEGDQEVKEGKGSKIQTSSINRSNKSWKYIIQTKKRIQEIRQVLYLLY